MTRKGEAETCAICGQKLYWHHAMKAWVSPSGSTGRGHRHSTVIELIDAQR